MSGPNRDWPWDSGWPAMGWATAMIDTSDGLSTDLGHICKASGVGAKVFAEKIPLVNVPPELQRKGLDPLQLAVDGGEDYELLFTVPKRLAGRVPQNVAGRAGDGHRRNHARKRNLAGRFPRQRQTSSAGRLGSVSATSSEPW